MESLQNLYKKLEKNKDFSNENNIENFLEIVNQLILKQDPSCISFLVKFLDDRREYSWVIEELQNYILYLIKNGGMSFFIKELEGLLGRCPLTCEAILSTIMNDKSCVDSLKTNIYRAPEDVVIKALDFVTTESPHHKELCEELKKLVQTNAGGHGS